MKKVISLVLVLLLTACSPTELTMDFNFINSVGKSLDDVCGQLNISKDKVTQSKLQGRYDIDIPVKYENVEFSPYLMFGDYNDKTDVLYGGGYEYITSDKGEELTKLVTSLKTTLTEKYGEPTTYEGLSNIIGDTTDFTQYSSGELTEQWTTSGENSGNITLKLIFDQGEVMVQIEYILTVTR